MQKITAGGDPNASRQFEKGKGETYRDITRFDDFGPEPSDETDGDGHAAARYAADCVTRQNNQNLDALSRGAPKKQKDIATVAGEM